MTTQTVSDPKQIKKIKWHRLDFDDDDNRFCNLYDEASTCCGVTEIGEISQGSFLKDIFVYSEEQDGWDPKYQKRATIEEVLEAFHNDLRGGMAVCYLVDNQHKGDFGKLIKADRWVYHGKFRNPNTMNVLHHWSKVLCKITRKKKSISIIPKRK